MAPSAHSAATQPCRAIANVTSGASSSCPAGPPAPITPAARPRSAGAVRRLTSPMRKRVAGDRGAGREDDEHQEDERDQGVDEDEQRRAEREQARAAGDDARRAEASCQRFDHRQGEARGELPEGRRQRDRRHAEAGRRVERRQEHAERRPAA
jgi:hypothetical protein